MVKVVYNDCYGGFGLSDEAITYGRTLTGDLNWGDLDHLFDIPRHDPTLVRVVEVLGSERASGRYSDLQIAENKEAKRYRIHEYDGTEAVIFGEQDDWVYV